METIGSCDTVLFELSESCWGNFYEGLNNYTLNCQNCQCPPIINHPNAKQKHAGSTLLLIDIDNDFYPKLQKVKELHSVMLTVCIQCEIFKDC